MQGPVGWVADLGALDAALKALAATLDHGLLNEAEGLESPTLERLCLWFAGPPAPRLPGSLACDGLASLGPGALHAGGVCGGVRCPPGWARTVEADEPSACRLLTDTQAVCVRP